MFFDTKGIVSTTVEFGFGQTTKVLDARQRNRNQFIQEIIHSFATQGNLSTDGLAFAQAVCRDRFLRAGNNGLLCSNRGQISRRRIQFLFIGNRFADAHVQHDFGQFRHSQCICVTEFFYQFGHNVFFINFTQSALHFLILNVLVP